MEIRCEDLSKADQQIGDAYFPLVKELFSVADGSVPTKFHGDLKRCLEMCVAIFSTAPIAPTPSHAVRGKDGINQDDFVLELCKKQFRAVYRRNYRGVSYLASQRLQEARKAAENKAIKMLSAKKKEELLPRLQELITQEGTWIEQINNNKRKKILDCITVDAVSEFQSEMEMEFPLLYSDGDFYEISWFDSQLHKMKVAALKDFEDQIPFRAEETEVLTAIATLNFDHTTTEQVVEGLIARNAENAKEVRFILEGAVDTAVANYEKTMTTFIRSNPLVKSMVLLKQHNEMKEEFRRSFPHKMEGQNSGTPYLEVECINQYENRVYDSFRQLMENGMNKAQETLHQLHKNGKSNVEHIIRDFHKDFANVGISQEYVDELRNRMENDIAAVMKQVKEESFAHARSLDHLLKESTPKLFLPPAELLTPDEEAKAILEKGKVKYKQILEADVGSDRSYFDALRCQKDVEEDVAKEIKTALVEKLGADKCEVYISQFLYFTEDHWQGWHYRNDDPYYGFSDDNCSYEDYNEYYNL